MTKLSKTLIAAAVFAALATSAYSQAAWEMKSGMGYHICRPRKNVCNGDGRDREEP